MMAKRSLRYGPEIRSKTLASLKPEISLDTLLADLTNITLVMNLCAPDIEKTTRVLDIEHVCNLMHVNSYQESDGQLVIFVGMLEENTDNLTLLNTEGHGLF
ncbi:hypothetical protein ACF0H5_016690 [Mactra antiquata]